MGDREKRKQSFLLNAAWAEDLELLTMSERGELLTMLFDYSAGNAANENASKAVQIVFRSWRRYIDANAERWAETCRKRAEASKIAAAARKEKAAARKAEQEQAASNDTKRYQTLSNDTKQGQTLANSSEYESEYESVSLQDKKEKGEKEKRDLAACVNAYERVSQMPITPAIGNQLSRFLLVMDADTVQAAITEAQDAGKASWRYMSAILTDWHNAGVRDAQTLSQYRERRRNNAADRRKSTAEAEHARYLARYAEKPTLPGIQLLG